MRKCVDVVVAAAAADNNNNNNNIIIIIIIEPRRLVFSVLSLPCSPNVTASFRCKIFGPSQSGSFHVISRCLFIETANAGRKSHAGECAAEKTACLYV